MMELRPTKQAEMAELKNLYRISFPKEERKPFWLIRARVKQGVMEVLSVVQDGHFAGLVITVLYRDLLLVDYLAIRPELRGKGIGSWVLAEILRQYPEKRIFLEIEMPMEGAENQAERLQRKRFYLQNGLVETGVRVLLFGTYMELLSFGCRVEAEEYLGLYRAFVGEAAAKKHVLLLDQAPQ